MTNSIPESLKNSYSPKEVTLFTLETIKHTINDSYGTDFQVLLLTSYGFIKCDINFEESSETIIKKTDSENTRAFDLNCIYTYRNSIINKQEKENPNIKVSDNGTILNLRNVTIYSGGLSNAHPIVNLNEFVIFVDQITGFSLIPRIVEG